MKTNLKKLACFAFLLFFFYGCNDSSLTDSPVNVSSTKSIDNNKNSKLSGTANWWMFFGRSVVQDRYNRNYSPDGINWNGLANFNALNFWPQYVRAASPKDNSKEAHLIYFWNNAYYLKRSWDGFTWSDGIKQELIITSKTPSGVIRHPEIAVVGSNVYLFQLIEHPQIPGSMAIKTFMLMGDYFDAIRVSPVLVPSTENFVNSDSDAPSFAEVNGQYFLFFNKNYMYSLTSSDLETWTNFIDFTSEINKSATHTDAVVHNGKVYVTYINPQNYLKYAIFNNDNGQWGWDGPYQIDVARTQGINYNIASDGEKLVVSFRGNGDNDSNYIAYSYCCNSWTVKKIGGSSYLSWREMLFPVFE